MLSVVLLFTGCNVSKKAKAADVDVESLRENSGKMIRITGTNTQAKDNDENNWTFITFEVDWSGKLTRSVGYRYTETLYRESTLTDEDYATLYLFAENARENDPYKDYSEKNGTGTSWTFRYTYDKSEPSFKIYDGFCNNVKELNEITHMLAVYFVPYNLTAPYSEDDVYDYITDGIEPTKNSRLYEDKTRVSVEEFKEYYGIADDEFNEDLLERYIFAYHIIPSDLDNDDYAEQLRALVRKGMTDDIGYQIMGIKYPPERTDLPLEDFIYEARWIYINFLFTDPEDGSEIKEDMMIDLAHKMIYFNCDFTDYRKAELVAELTDEDIERIRQGLPPTVINYGLPYDICIDYEYEISIVNYRSQSLYYYSTVPDEYNLAFDAFWHELYEYCFGAPHEAF